MTAKESYSQVGGVGVCKVDSIDVRIIKICFNKFKIVAKSKRTKKIVMDKMLVACPPEINITQTVDATL